MFDRIIEERKFVEGYVTKTPVYGFSTLFGHYDHHTELTGLSQETQNSLLQAHLVGTPVPTPVWFFRSLADTKLTQLNNGGTGISGDAYKAVQKAAGLSDDAELSGSWFKSYGCGDVVDGSWFVHNLIEQGLLTLSRSGDLMALINGSYVSTTVARSAYDFFKVAIEDSLNLLKANSNPTQAVQLPVTLRDLSPLLDSYAQSSHQMDEALTHREETKSGNPLFDMEQGTHLSNASFLDFTLTHSLTGAGQTTQVAGIYVKALTNHVSKHMSVPSPADTPIQPTKVNTGLVKRMIPLSPDFYLNESETVEDVGDMSSHTALGLIHNLKLLREANNNLHRLLGEETTPIHRAEELLSL